VISGMGEEMMAAVEGTRQSEQQLEPVPLAVLVLVLVLVLAVVLAVAVAEPVGVV
jgi:hypothetical protein